MRKHRPCEERDASGNVTCKFFNRGEIVSGTVYFYSRNHLRSVSDLTNSGGTVVTQLAYDSFGRGTVVNGSIRPNFEFASYYIHQRSGLNLTLTRAYNAALGRFISRDPIRERGGINLFAYVRNRPNMWVDPSGLGEQGKVHGGDWQYEPLPEDGDHGEGDHWKPDPPPPPPPDCVDMKDSGCTSGNQGWRAGASDDDCKCGDKDGNCCVAPDGTRYNSKGKRICDTGPHHDQPPPPPNPAGA